jgi:RimJ/RimL family protein N-acetyltransferase
MDRADRHNDLGQPIGFAIDDWQPVSRPPRTPMTGRTCIVEPLDPARHAADLFAANAADVEGRNFTYLAQQPFDSLESYTAWMETVCKADDPLFHAIVSADTGKPVGIASFMRIDPNFGVIEVGNINYSPALQRTTAATEAMFAMMRRAFDELGYRRYEWKCDELNGPSRRAAERLGFRFEGIFRQHMVYKGRNRNTVWFSIVDAEWPALKRAYETWLSPKNFDENGGQRRDLKALIAEGRGTA